MSKTFIRKAPHLIVCILLIPLGLIAQTNAQENDSIAAKKRFAAQRIGTKAFELTESQKADSAKMEDPVVFLGEGGKIGVMEARDFYYSFVESYVREGKLCLIHYCPDSAIEAFFENYAPVVIPEYFLLGTLNEVKDRQTKLEEQEVDRYPLEDKFLTDYLADYVRKTFGIEAQTSLTERKRDEISLYSSELLEIIDPFFDEETGAPKDNLFRTNEEICSYLLGAYFRYGNKRNDKILIDELYLRDRKENTTVYFLSSFRIDISQIFSLLRDVCCNNILFSSSSTRGVVPGRSRIFFEPSAYLENYFQSIEPEKEKLEKSRSEYRATLKYAQ